MPPKKTAGRRLGNLRRLLHGHNSMNESNADTASSNEVSNANVPASSTAETAQPTAHPRTLPLRPHQAHAQPQDEGSPITSTTPPNSPLTVPRDGAISRAHVMPPSRTTTAFTSDALNASLSSPEREFQVPLSSVPQAQQEPRRGAHAAASTTRPGAATDAMTRALQREMEALQTRISSYLPQPQPQPSSSNPQTAKATPRSRWDIKDPKPTTTTKEVKDAGTKDPEKKRPKPAPPHPPPMLHLTGFFPEPGHRGWNQSETGYWFHSEWIHDMGCACRDCRDEYDSWDEQPPFGLGDAVLGSVPRGMPPGFGFDAQRGGFGRGAGMFVAPVAAAPGSGAGRGESEGLGLDSERMPRATGFGRGLGRGRGERERSVSGATKRAIDADADMPQGKKRRSSDEKEEEKEKVEEKTGEGDKMKGGESKKAKGKGKGKEKAKE